MGNKTREKNRILIIWLREIARNIRESKRKKLRTKKNKEEKMQGSKKR